MPLPELIPGAWRSVGLERERGCSERGSWDGLGCAAPLCSVPPRSPIASHHPAAPLRWSPTPPAVPAKLRIHAAPVGPLVADGVH
ncbi:hypothetical protein SKAU_G00144810 [Synaphobranchus kaupii]|uniref:Uncharacterized protein n=1 Tax=Synaphobranchus kaupii TaxID=118154 RepID=A0A9Q1FT12_SYNKA|nr:hypothetical protein SKAU_G00144810 [Synaphobranchus kaupii]